MKDLLTPLIALLAVWIAYQQWRTQRDKLRLDLFDRRAKVFEALTTLLYAIQRDGKATRPLILAFGAATASAGFLFDRDMAEYLEEVRRRAVEQMQTCERLIAHQYDHEFEERAALMKEESDLLKWLTGQIEDSRRRFHAYLGFSNVRTHIRQLPNER